MAESTDLLVRIREAMESDSIARKNITLFEALREIERRGDTIQQLIDGLRISEQDKAAAIRQFREKEAEVKRLQAS